MREMKQWKDESVSKVLVTKVNNDNETDGQTGLTIRDTGVAVVTPWIPKMLFLAFVNRFFRYTNSIKNVHSGLREKFRMHCQGRRWRSILAWNVDFFL